jgi:hypothetical protein
MTKFMNNLHIVNTEENILRIISNISQDARHQAFLNALMRAASTGLSLLILLLI